jgi:nucleoid DNA-binding protein
MEKPKSLSIKDFIVRKMSVKMLIPEFTLDAVVSHQFYSANQAMINAKSVELSGFGTFFFNNKKAIKKMEKHLSQKALFEKLMNDHSLSDQRRNNARLKYDSAILAINALKPKLVYIETKSDLSGMEEQLISTSSPERIDTNNVSGETKSL